jgi:hypothetical protein
VSFDDRGRSSSLAYDGSAIIVTQTARNNERIRNILARYNDVRQVEIEAEVHGGAGGSTRGTRRYLEPEPPRRLPSVNPDHRCAHPRFNNGRQIFDCRRKPTPAPVSPARSSERLPQHANNVQTHQLVIGGILPSTTRPKLITNQTDSSQPPRAGRRAYHCSRAACNSLASGANALGPTSLVSSANSTSPRPMRALSQKQGTDLLSSPKAHRPVRQSRQHHRRSGTPLPAELR